MLDTLVIGYQRKWELNTEIPGVICVPPGGFLAWCWVVTNAVMATIIFPVCCDESKRLLFWSDQCRNWKSSVWNILWCLKNEFSFQILYEVIARILFSACWDIKTNILLMEENELNCLKYYMKWLHSLMIMFNDTLCKKITFYLINNFIIIFSRMSLIISMKRSHWK